MRNQWTMTVCGVLLASAFASAQPPPTEPTRPQDPTPVPAPRAPELQKPQPKPDEPAPAVRLTRSDLKLTGCLQRGEETAGPVRGAAPAGADKAPLAGGFVLRQATPTPSKDMKESGTPAGTKEYRLVARDDSVKLADHVGHQVSITGQVALGAESGAASTDKATSASRPSGSTGVETTPPGGAAALAPAVTVTVSSLKMVAPSCGTPAS
jgi:hypothetical protein